MLGILSYSLGTPIDSQIKRPFLHVPSVTSYATHNPSGVTILPEGRFIKPAGTSTPLSRWPFGMILIPGTKSAFVASKGMGQWIDNWDTAPKVDRFQTGIDTSRSNSGALALSKDRKFLYWSNGEKGGVFVYDAVNRKYLEEISINGELGSYRFADSYVNDVALSEDGRFLFCADVTNFRLAVIDLSSKKLVSSVPTGRYPYSVTVSGSRAFVANIGQFAYSPIPSTNDPRYSPKGITFPAFGYPSRDAVAGVQFEGRFVPGLGDPMTNEAFSVYGYDMSNPLDPKLKTSTKTGAQIGSQRDFGKVIGGSGPSFVLAQGDRVFVSNSNNDTVDIIDAKSGKITGSIALTPPIIRGLRGLAPSGLALSKDGRTLFVTESGLNSIAVVDVAKRAVKGRIPTAWFPYRVNVSEDGKTLACICFRGYGNGPKMPNNPVKSDYLGLVGSFHSINIPTDKELKSMTDQVMANNGLVDAEKDRTALKSPVWSGIPGQRSEQIKYVVFITKENHTYDAIFDRIPGAKHDPSLLLWGNSQTVTAPNQPKLENVSVMRNHNKLAKQFTVSDNFYMEPEASGVGHRWLVGIQPNNFTQMLYTLGWGFKLSTSAQGRRASFGSNGSIAPEDYPEAGSMWEHLARNNISFRNYGEGFEFAGVLEDENEEPTGALEVVNILMSKVLYDNTSRNFPIFNMNIPDIYRAEQFENEINERYIKSGHELPSFLNIAICNDHGADVKPAKGYPYRASWMADNDYALGKIIEFLSKTKYWKNMLILVTQDDSGGENDHVDAQRSVLLAVGPYVKRGYVSHRQTTITSMHRTLFEIFGLPPLNFFDAVSNNFSDCFTDKPDFSPYVAEDVDHRIFDWQKVKAMNKKDPEFLAARNAPTIRRDTYEEEEMEREAEERK